MGVKLAAPVLQSGRTIQENAVQMREMPPHQLHDCLRTGGLGGVMPGGDYVDPQLPRGMVVLVRKLAGQKTIASGIGGFLNGVGAAAGDNGDLPDRLSRTIVPAAALRRQFSVEKRR